ncbi:MAG: class I SAM-dependent methyltransferase [Solirubrobacteraceae bacterium]
MDPARASMTAMGASMMRARHSRLDRPPLIDDDWGYRLVTDADREMLLKVGLSFLPSEARAHVEALGSEDEMLTFLARANPSYGTVVIRTRYAEDALAAAITAGTRQIVIIGAGMDTLALRRPGFPSGVEVFEIDHPATQEFKLERLGDAGVSAPAGLHYLPADLNLTGVDAVLDRSSFNPGRPAFFSWLGVTAYLTREANLNTFRAIASVGAPGSELVFNYLEQRIFDSSDEEAQRVRAVFASLSEPWVSGFDPSELGDDLRGVGLELVENLDSEDLRERYCAARDDGLSPSFGECLARAHITA